MALACVFLGVATGVFALFLPVWLVTRGFSAALVVLAIARWRGSEELTRIARGRGFDVVLLLLLAGGSAYLSFSPGL